MRTAIVGAVAVVALFGTVADAEARRCRCTGTANFYRGPAADYQAYRYNSRGGIGPPGWPQQYVGYDTERAGRCGPDRRWQDGRCVRAR
jgi:hypothetical protein